MKKSIAGKIIIEALQYVYDKREASNIAKFYLQDKWRGKSKINENEFLQDLKKLACGVPLAYVTGKTFFYDRYYTVNQDVLIPRAETEELCHLVIKKYQQHWGKGIEIGTGSGCIAITLASQLESIRMTAIDISQKAITIAQKNAKVHAQEILFRCMNFLSIDNWNNLPSYNFIVSNPPYIGKDEIPKMGKNTFLYEPELALFPLGNNRLIFYEKIGDFGQKHLVNDGMIFCELNEYYADDIAHIFYQKDYRNILIHKDLQGKKRMLSCQRAV